MLTAMDARMKTSITRELLVNKALLEAEIAVRKSTTHCETKAGFYVDYHIKKVVEEELFQLGYKIIPTERENTIVISWEV